jgi:hypothetical protein
MTEILKIKNPLCWICIRPIESERLRLYSAREQEIIHLCSEICMKSYFRGGQSLYKLYAKSK